MLDVLEHRGLRRPVDSAAAAEICVRGHVVVVLHGCHRIVESASRCSGTADRAPSERVGLHVAEVHAIASQRGRRSIRKLRRKLTGARLLQAGGSQWLVGEHRGVVHEATRHSLVLHLQSLAADLETIHRFDGGVRAVECIVRDESWKHSVGAAPDAVHSPNPLESEVFLSTNTFAEMTLPKGAKSVARSASVRSRGRW